MAAANRTSRLKKKLAEIEKRDGGTIKIDSIAEIVEQTVGAALKRSSSGDPGIVSELQILSEYIEGARRDIAALKPVDVKNELLPSASDELDAIVAATETATHEIMAATEAIDEICSGLDPEVSAQVMDATIRIYTACGFQDITGQRIGKIVTALRNIEERVDALIDALGGTGAKTKRKAAKKTAPKSKAKALTKTKTKTKSKAKTKKAAARKATAKKSKASKKVSDEDLLEGPQMPDSAISQEDVDALLASFD